MLGQVFPILGICPERLSMLKKQTTLWMLIWVAQVSWAQTLTSAGSQLQQLPTLPTQPGNLEPTVLPSDQTPPTMPASRAVFEVKRLQIKGATLYSEEVLLSVTGFEPGRALGLQGLQIMAQRITRHYQQGGYPVARAYLPAQEIRDGVVTLAVLEGRYGRVLLGNTSALQSQVPRDLLTGLNPGDVIAMPPLKERLLLLSDVPGVQVRSSLVPGATLGLSDLWVQVTPGARFTGSVDMDNAGSRYTGERRIGTTLQLNKPWGRGDQAREPQNHQNNGQSFKHLRAFIFCQLRGQSRRPRPPPQGARGAASGQDGAANGPYACANGGVLFLLRHARASGQGQSGHG